MPNSIAKAIFVLTAVSGIAFSSLAQETLTARLTMMPIDEVNRGIVTGSGSATAEIEGNNLTIQGSFSGLSAPATAARLHESIQTGIRGTALYDLVVTSAAEGAFSGDIELTDDQVEKLRQGRLYIQIDSASSPNGNLWGWLLR